MLTGVLIFALSQVGAPGATGPALNAAELERFKIAFTKAESLYADGDLGAAIWNFRQADRIRPTPEVAYDLAKCHEKLNDTAVATFWYRQYLRRAPNAPDGLMVAERVGAVLAKAEADGWGILEVVAPGAEAVRVGNAEFADAPAAVLLPPGEVELKARFPSGVKTMVAQVRTGKTTAVSFEPLPPPVLSLEDARTAPLFIADAPNRGPSKLRLASYVTFGAGLAALAVGIVLGALSVGDGAQSQNTIYTTLQAQAYADAANQKALAGDVLMAVGGTASLAGVAMFIFSRAGAEGSASP